MAKKAASAAVAASPAEAGPAVELRGLMEVAPQVKAAGEAVGAIDACLYAGFARLASEQMEGLHSVAAVFRGTPLETRFGAAVAAIGRNEFDPSHFAAIAAGRGALESARYDALREQVDEVLGRTTEELPQKAGTAAAGQVLCESARHWLMELAIAGFKQLDVSALAPFGQTLEAIQNDAALVRLACVLTGFRQELLAALPMGQGAAIPTRRWGDLWMRGMLSSLQAGLPAAVAGKVSGALQVLGVDLRQSEFFASAVVYGMLRAGDEERVVRVTLSSYKVDALQGREIWRCFAEEKDKAAMALLEGISSRAPLAVKEMSLLETGDLLWDGAAAPDGKGADVFALAGGLDAGVKYPSVPPADRHPVQLAEIVCLRGVKITQGEGGMELAAGDARVPVEELRIPAGSELTKEAVLGCDALIGLLRWDGGGWRIQPLAVRGGEGKKAVDAWIGQDAYEVVTAKPKKGQPNTLAVLQERASRLLRKKS